jgi:hypothetical protein
MKKTLYILILVSFISCTFNETSNETSDLNQMNFILDSQIENNQNSMEMLMAINPNHVLPYYDEFVNIRLKYEDIIYFIQNTRTLENASQLKGLFDYFYDVLINIDAKNKTYTDNINTYFSFRGYDKNRLFNSIETVEIMFKQTSLYAFNHLRENIYYDYLLFERIHILVVPEKTTISLGEEYSAKIYIVADTLAMTEAYINEYDSNNIFLMNPNLANQSLNFSIDKNAFIFKDTPTKKGIYKKQGVIKFNHPKKGGTRAYSFTIDYEVN